MRLFKLTTSKACVVLRLTTKTNLKSSCFSYGRHGKRIIDGHLFHRLNY